MRDYFEQQAATWDDDPTRVARSRMLAERIRETVKVQPGQHVIEFGCGTGVLGLTLASYGVQVTFVDESAAMIKVVQERIAAWQAEQPASTPQCRANTVVADGFQPQVLPTGVDGVVCALALHHVPEVAAVVSTFAQVLRPGGFLAIADLHHDPEGNFHAHHADFHGHHGFVPAELAQLVGGCGFSPVEYTTVGTLRKDVNGEPHDFPLFLLTATRSFTVAGHLR